MGYNQGLAVGLSIGVPGFLILLAICGIWWKYQHRRRKETDVETDIDIELRDDMLMRQFKEEITKQYQKVPPQTDKTKAYETGSESTGGSFMDSSNSKSKVLESPALSSDTQANNNNNKVNNNTTTTNNNNNNTLRSHKKTLSSYDIYESMIPVLKEEQVGGGSQAQSTNGDLAGSRNNLGIFSTPAKVYTHNNSSQHQSLNDGSSSHLSMPLLAAPGTQNPDKLLDSLAKQLHNPLLFEKLPSNLDFPTFSGAGSPGARASGHLLLSRNNSSSDLLNNVLIGEDTNLNDNYVYETRGHPGPSPLASGASPFIDSPTKKDDDKLSHPLPSMK